MSDYFRKYIGFVIFLLTVNLMFAQRGIKIGFAAGKSLPQGSFQREFNFAKSGINYNVDIDYYFGLIGFGISGGITSNQSKNTFLDYANSQYSYRNYTMSYDNWIGSYLALGPSIQLTYKKIGIDLYGKLGFVNLQIPDIFYNVEYFDQNYNAMKYWGEVDNIMGMWLGGMRTYYNITDQLSIQLKGDLQTTKFFSGITNTMSFKDVKDSNSNGFIDDVEFFEAPENMRSSNVIYSNFNLSAGFLFRLGGDQKNNQADLEVYSDEDPFLIADTLAVYDDLLLEQMDDIYQKDTNLADQDINKKKDEVVELGVSDDSSNVKYENLSADEYLFKAGKKYLENDEFNKSIACFESLGAKKGFEMAQYYKSIALLKIGKCKEGSLIFNNFKTDYPELNTPSNQLLFETVLKVCLEEQVLKMAQSELQVDEKDVLKHDFENENKVVVDNLNEKVKNQEKEEVVIVEETIDFDIDEELDSEIEEIGNAKTKINIQKDFDSKVIAEIDKEDPSKINREVSESKVAFETEKAVIISDPIIPKTKNTKENINTLDTNKVLVRLPSGVINKDFAEENIIYKVQFVALKKNYKSFKNVSKIGEIEIEHFKELNRYRYMLGPYTNLDKARMDMEEVRKLGFEDAFIAIYKEGERVVTFYHPIK